MKAAVDSSRFMTPEKITEYCSREEIALQERNAVRDAFLGGMLYAQGHLVSKGREKKLLDPEPPMDSDDGLGGPVAQLILTLCGYILYEEVAWRDFWRTEK